MFKYICTIFANIKDAGLFLFPEISLENLHKIQHTLTKSFTQQFSKLILGKKKKPSSMLAIKVYIKNGFNHYN